MPYQGRRPSLRAEDLGLWRCRYHCASLGAVADVSPQRPILLSAVRGLIAAAQARRSLEREGAPERQFFLGVEAAAEEVIHPELGSTRGEGWLEHERPAFREGYLRTATLLAHARTAPEPPLTLPLPEPPAQ